MCYVLFWKSKKSTHLDDTFQRYQGSKKPGTGGFYMKSHVFIINVGWL